MINKQSILKEQAESGDAHHNRQAGQSIVIIAFAIIGILAFVGIAVDVGLVFARSTQLQSAVDSAALAGVPELIIGTNGLNAANRKAEQFFYTNGFDITVTAEGGGGIAIGRQPTATELGALRYELTADWPVDLFFLKLIGRDTVTLTRRAVAGIFPMADIYASRRIEDGILSTSNQAVFGPASCTNMGDPFSPDASPWDQGLYTYQYRILVPPDYNQDVIRVELFDPDSINQSGDTFEIQHTRLATNAPHNLPLFETKYCPYVPADNIDDRPQYQPCVLDTGEAALGGTTLDEVNPFWFVRIDENRYGTSGNNDNSSCGANTYTTGNNTQTTYVLYYYAQNDDGTLHKITLATYTGQVGDGVRDNGSHLTDMQWVSPGGQLSVGQPANVPTDCGSPNGGDYDPVTCPGGSSAGSGNGFEVSIANDLGNILVDPGNGNRYLYLDVTAISGSSENGFEVWAGPNTYVNDIPSDANLRNLTVLNYRGSHTSKGITVFGMGRLPMNSNYTNRVEIPLIWVGPENAGQPIFISLFDSDSGAAPPINFYFDSIAYDDWHITFAGTEGGRCKIGNCNNQWVDPAYEIDVPGDIDNCTTPDPDDPSCIPFYGGRLTASYIGGNHDTYGWEVRLSGQPYLEQ